MWYYTLLVSVAILFIIFFIRQQRKLKGSETFSKKTSIFFKSIEDFNPTFAIFGENDDSGRAKAMAIDTDRELICLFEQNENNEYHILDYSEIISSEIFENGTSISYFSDESKILKFNFEKELSEEEKRIYTLSVECKFISEEVPLFRVYTIHSSKPADRNEYLFKKDETNKWHRLMVKIIDSNNQPIKQID